MSFELPVVTTNVYGNGEFVRDGVTGYVVAPPEHVLYYDPDEKFIPTMDTGRRHEFIKSIERTDQKVIANLTDKVTVYHCDQTGEPVAEKALAELQKAPE